jgi:Glycosyl transferase 4-like
VRDVPTEKPNGSAVLTPRHAADNVGRRVVLFANTDRYLYNFRRPLASAIRERGQELLLISPPGIFGPRPRDLGFRWEPLDVDRRSLRPDREAWLILQLTRLLRRERPTLIDNFTIKCAVYGSLAAHLANVPCRVNAIAGLGYVFTSNNWRARLGRSPRSPVRSSPRRRLGGNRLRLLTRVS